MSELTNPIRLQLKWVKGWRLQAASIAANGLAGRLVMRPHRFGNPFQKGKPIPEWHYLAGIICPDTATAIRLFGKWFVENPARVADAKEKLKGFNLFCSCKRSAPCHADVLLEIANQ